MRRNVYYLLGGLLFSSCFTNTPTSFRQLKYSENGTELSSFLVSQYTISSLSVHSIILLFFIIIIHSLQKRSKLIIIIFYLLYSGKGSIGTKCRPVFLNMRKHRQYILRISDFMRLTFTLSAFIMKLIQSIKVK